MSCFSSLTLQRDCMIKSIRTSAAVLSLAIPFLHPAQQLQNAHYEEHPCCHCRLLCCGSEPAVPDSELGQWRAYHELHIQEPCCGPFHSRLGARSGRQLCRWQGLQRKPEPVRPPPDLDNISANTNAVSSTTLRNTTPPATPTSLFTASPKTHSSSSTLSKLLQSTIRPTMLASRSTATTTATVPSMSCGPSTTATSASTGLSGGQAAAAVPSLSTTTTRLG